MKTFIFKEDPFNFGHSRSFVESTLFRHLEPTPYSVYERTMESYIENPDSICPVIRHQMENCAELKQELDLHTRFYNDNKDKEKRMEEDEVFRAEEKSRQEDSWLKFKSRFLDDQDRMKGVDYSKSKDKSRKHEYVVQDNKPEVGDIWHTKNYLPYLDGPENVEFRHVDDPSEVILLSRIDDDHWLVAPVEPEFISWEPFRSEMDLEHWTYSSKDSEGEDYLEYIAWVHFYTVMAEGQLKKRSGYSHLDPGMISIHSSGLVDVDNLDSLGPLIPQEVADMHGISSATVNTGMEELVGSSDFASLMRDRHYYQNWANLWCSAKLLNSMSRILREDEVGAHMQVHLTEYLSRRYANET